MTTLARRWILVAALLGGSGVALGAFGAHGLPDRLADMGYEGADVTRRVEIFETAVRYQLIHALALGLLGVLLDRAQLRSWILAAYFFVFGVLIFSGLLYALAFVGDQLRWLGAIVPIGGVAMIVGWILLAVGATGSNPSSEQ